MIMVGRKDHNLQYTINIHTFNFKIYHMKNTTLILALICIFSFSSCSETSTCETPTNGFLTDTDFQVKMGSSEAVKVFNDLDDAWAKLDYDTMKTFIAEDATFSFSDGFVAKGPQEFIDKIKSQAAKSLAEGNNYEWTTNYAFALALTDDGDEATLMDVGDWVNAQFTSKNSNPDSEIASEIIYEYYHIVDGKVTSWSQFKKTIKN